VSHKSSQDTPVIFFGTSEVGWIGQKDVTEWEAGMQQHFHIKGRKNKKFVTSLEQVRPWPCIHASDWASSRERGHTAPGARGNTPRASSSSGSSPAHPTSLPHSPAAAASMAHV
jgi:hypothetical protein